MTTELYLDTARLGRMCRGARVAEQDFATLASQLGSSLYLREIDKMKRVEFRGTQFESTNGTKARSESVAGYKPSANRRTGR